MVLSFPLQWGNASPLNILGNVFPILLEIIACNEFEANLTVLVHGSVDLSI